MGGLEALAAGSAVAEVGHAGRGSGVLDEDFAVQIGDGEGFAVDDDQDVLESVLAADHVGDGVQAEGAGRAQSLQLGVLRQVRGLLYSWSSECRCHRWLEAWPVWFGTWRVGLRCRFPCGQGCDAPGEPLVGAFGVVDVVERVDVGLKFGQALGEVLLVEVSEQGLVEAFVLALGGRLVGLAGDGLDPQCARTRDELAEVSASGWVECGPVVGQESLGYPVSGHGLVEHGDGGLGGFAPRDV